MLPLLRVLPKRARASMLPEVSFKEAARAFDPGAGVPGLPDWECISPLCWTLVGLHRSHQERDDRFLTQLGWEFKIINSFWGALLGADLESSLEHQQRFWKILEYRVIDEQSCTWVAKARRVYSLDAPEEEARVRVLLARGFQSLVLDESVAGKLFHS